jgi:hypothetical protein
LVYVGSENHANRRNEEADVRKPTTWMVPLFASAALVCGCTSRTEAEEKAQPPPETLPEPQREEVPVEEPAPPPAEEPQPPPDEPAPPEEG